MSSGQNHIFKLYSRIEPNDYLQKIKFYEEKTSQIFELEVEQQYFLKYEFVKALAIRYFHSLNLVFIAYYYDHHASMYLMLLTMRGV